MNDVEFDRERERIFKGIDNECAKKSRDKTEFEQILDEMLELHHRKMGDYARPEDPYLNFRKNSGVWGTLDYLEPLKRATEKMIRISELTQKNKEPNNESIDDSILDIAILAVISLAIRRENGR